MLAASKDLGEVGALTTQGRTLATSSLTYVHTKAKAGQDIAEDGSGKIREPETEEEMEATREQKSTNKGTCQQIPD